MTSKLGWAIAIGLCLGCGEPRRKTFPISGRVVFADGSPVKVGTIETKSIQHSVQATGKIERDGSFSLTTYQEGDGAVEGEHQCVVVQFIPLENAESVRVSTTGVVNRKHASYATSGLTLRVSAESASQGKNREIELRVEGVDGTKGTSKHGKNDKHKFDHEPEPN
jgi:hypothetical protein